MIRLFNLLIVLISTISGCATIGTSKTPTPPITLPFAVHKAGATVSTELRITLEGRPYKYPFLLNFNFIENDSAERDRLKNLFMPKKNMVGYELGVPIPLLIKIFVVDATGEHLFMEKRTFLGRGYSDGVKDFLREIDHVRLNPGLYRVTVQSLKDIRELADTKVTFGIYNPRSK